MTSLSRNILIPMRLADLLVDLAAVASASRSVASKHVALRANQLDRYKKTSRILTTLRPQQPPSAGQEAPAQTAGEPKPKPEAEAPGRAKEQGPVADEPVRIHVHVADVQPAALRPEENVPKATGSGFVPAPWATTVGVARQGVPARPGAPRAGPLRRGPIQIPIEEPEREDTAHLMSDQVDVNVFRTSRGSNILEALDDVQGGQQEQLSEEAVGNWDISAPAMNDIQAVKPVTQGDIETIAELAGSSTDTSATARTAPAYELRESRVPSSRIGRLWNYGGLAAGMFAGAIGEGLSRAVGGGSGNTGSVMLSPANMERLVAKLSRMRGAALKMGQMMSFQDAKMLPGPIQEVLQRVQDRADYMPAWQRDRVLTANLGPEWRDLFEEFGEKPIAAASIGQVHRATLKSNGARVAVKIQFPGVADSINSDLDNLSVLLAAANLLPKGLYLNKTIDNARTELAWECDYDREAECAARYREHLAGGEDEAIFAVPQIYPEASGKHVLTMEFMDGVGVTRINSFTQAQRDWIGTQILRLCLREITEFRFMQTDPNWTNFLYNAERDRLELLDFGASRAFPDEFISRYVALLEAASRSDRGRVKELSEELGYLTGHESRAMLDAHTTSVMTLAEPFLQSAPEVYDFSDQTITERVKAQIPVMIHERLAPPPEETYSLHRKLSGAFLLCARLGSKVRCRELFEQALVKAEALSSAK